ISREEYLEELETRYTEAINQYGAIEQGENARNTTAVPKQVSEDKYTERFIRTVIETGKLTPEMIEDVEEQILLGDIYSYEPLADEAAAKRADAQIERGTAENVWQTATGSGVFSKDTIAVGEKLLLQAIEADDRAKVLEISSDLADMLTKVLEFRVIFT
ncbi:MAG: hypothetical protein II802_03025, partial [Clostridia bacterium]|nr:hypothetical protein [Clostridia bacterium]